MKPYRFFLKRTLNRNTLKLSIYAIVLGISGCLLVPPDKFIAQDFMLVRPFKKVDTVIFTSAKGLVDTIVFFPTKTDSGQVKSFELGFYNYYGMIVQYALTDGSYHVISLPKEEQPLYTKPTKLYGVEVTSEDNQREFRFLDLYFDDSLIKTFPVNANIIEIKAKDNNKRNKTIFSFKFSPQAGILSYIDTGGIEWSRTKKW